ncbi:MAG: transporter [Rhodobacteraceae bacterium]|nr:transporter [Paracoccaceae bacterium]
MRKVLRFLAAAGLLAVGVSPALAQDDGSTAKLAKDLANPVANLISVPLQYNYNSGIGPDDGHQSYINIQPVIPFSIAPNWNIISRTILPVVWQDDVVPGAGSQSGLGNTLQSFFLSPKDPGPGGLIWGVGPVIQIPTATDGIARNQWGLGPTGVALVQRGPVTMGLLANHVWSVTNNNGDNNMSNSYLQPFVVYTTPKATSFGINTESTYNWESEEWSVPINAFVGQVVKVGDVPVQFNGGIRYWAESPEGGPQDWGARFQMTVMLPR